MFANEQNNGGKMQIGELAKRAAVTVDAIRFYEKRRLLPKPLRSTGRFRLYAADDIERLRFIRQMHGLGFSLREIKELIDLRTERADESKSVRELLKQKLAGVRAKLRELRRLETELSADLQKCDRELRHRQRHAADTCPVLQEATPK
jgi:DNA-binding transcriptional MerR regulator